MKNFFLFLFLTILTTVGCAGTQQDNDQVEVTSADGSADIEMATYDVVTPMLERLHPDPALTYLDEVREAQVTKSADMTTQNVYGTVRIQYPSADDRVDKYRCNHTPSYMYSMKSHQLPRHPLYTVSRNHSRI
jgi:hypothetical protein